MLNMFILGIVSLIISTILWLLAALLSEKSSKEREKFTPFECGFSPFKKARSSFSLRFFMTTLIFLIFDIEIALLLPLGVVSKSPNLPIMLMLAYIITLILLLGLLHEWKQGALNWVK